LFNEHLFNNGSFNAPTNTLLNISGTNSDLGDKIASFNITYEIIDFDPYDLLNITITLDSIVIGGLGNTEPGEYTEFIDIDLLPLGNHIIKIKVMDSQFETRTRTYTFYKKDVFKINNIDYIEVKNCIVDQLHVRELTASPPVDLTNIKDDWQPDTRLLAKFNGNLTAGNYDNEGVAINRFAIKRRISGETNNITIGYVDINSGTTNLQYIDYSQPVGSLVYSLVPISEIGLEGRPNEVSVESDFSGWWIVDKNNNVVFEFGKEFGSDTTVDVQLNQSRIQIDTLSDYPNIYYLPQKYHTFTLSAVVVPTKYSITEWNRLLAIINQHIPLIVKSGNGDYYICDVHTPNKQVRLNRFPEADVFTVVVNCIEIMDVDEYFSS